LLAACNGELAVVDDLDHQSSNLATDGPDDPDATTPPRSFGPCECASSASLMALQCGNEVPLLDNDIVQTTPDGSIAAFSVTLADGSYQVQYWDGTSVRPLSGGLLIGLSASGEQVLTTGEGFGLTWLDVTRDAVTNPAIDAVAGRGSLSADGQTIIGATYPGDVTHLVRANASTGEIEDLGQIVDTIARAYVTPDASNIVGFTIGRDDPATSGAFRWSEPGLSFGLPGVPAGVTAWPESVSAEGSVITGRSLPGRMHFRWTEAGGYVELAPASWFSEGMSSSDGSVAVGSFDPDGEVDTSAFRWTEATGVLDLTPGVRSFATDLSDDGSVVVATRWDEAQNDGSFPEDTFVWDEAHGTRTLDDVLQARSVDTGGWEFGQARALSGDGKVLLGRALCGGVPALYRIVLSD
jgi:hypothetical protein